MNDGRSFLKNGPVAVMERFELLKAMNIIVKMCNDERVYERWIYVIPDQCEDDELLGVAMEDADSYQDACELFRDLMCGEGVQEGGFYAGNQVF